MRTITSRPEGMVAGLADAIKALRAELVEAMSAGKEERLKFELGAVTMEFAVELTVDAEASGGVRFWVVGLDGKGSVGRTSTHTVSLEMKPKIGERSVLISDDE